MMQNFELYESSVKREVPQASQQIIIAHYRMWLRNIPKETFDEEQVITSINDYISSHIPGKNQVAVADLVPDIDRTSAMKWLKSEKINGYDTLQGVYVDEQDANAVTTLAFDLSPIDLEFYSRCKEFGIEPGYAEYFHFKRSLPRTIVHSNYHHPIYPTHKEFFTINNKSALVKHIDRWISEQKATDPVNVEGFMSLSDAADQCSVSINIMNSWVQLYPEKLQVINGQVIVDELFIASVAEHKQTIVLIKDVLQQALAESQIKRGTKADTIEYVNQLIANRDYDWLVGDREVPGITPREYCDANCIDKAMKDIKDVIDDYPGRPLKELEPITGLKLPALIELAERGIINSVERDGVHYISNTEHLIAQQYCEEHVALDDIVSAIVITHKAELDITLVKHRNNFLDYLETCDCASLLVDVEKTGVPMAGKKLGLIADKNDVDKITEECSPWIRCYGKLTEAKIQTMLSIMGQKYPSTTLKMRSYLGFKNENRDNAAYEMLCTMLACMNAINTELTALRHKEDMIREYFIEPFSIKTIVSADRFADFIHKEDISKNIYTFSKTGYHLDNTAYTVDCYSVMIAATVNEDYWQQNDLVAKAIDNPQYAKLWMYVGLHCMAAWRTTDYVRLPVPRLEYDAHTTIELIREGTYPDIAAITVAEKYMDRIQWAREDPNKTKGKPYVSPLYFYVPESCRKPFGIILSIAAAHFLLEDHSPTESFIQPIKDLHCIQQFFGDEFVSACGGRNFSGRRANKSLIQAVEMTAQQKGMSPYIAFALASNIRSHQWIKKKGLSKTTAVYLEDGKFSGYSPQYIMEQMFERGVLSFIVNNLFEMAYGVSYSSLPIATQTDIIKGIDVVAWQVDDMIQCAFAAEDNAVKAIKTIMQTNGSKSPKEILEAIITGNGSGKEDNSYCAATAAGIGCQCPQRQHCLGCIYEIKSKDVLLKYVLGAERLQKRYTDTTGEVSQFEKNKIRHLIKTVYGPGIAEITKCLMAVSTAEEYETNAILIRERTKHCNELDFDCTL